jgi:hypothetical protein
LRCLRTDLKAVYFVGTRSEAGTPKEILLSAVTPIVLQNADAFTDVVRGGEFLP